MSSSVKHTYEPVTQQELADQIALGMHTGLRKGSDAPSSGPLWQAIAASEDTAWSDAARFCAYGLESMGYEVRRKITTVVVDKQVGS